MSSTRRFSLALMGPALFSLLLASAPCQEHKELGRMWTFENVPVDFLKEAYGFEPSQRIGKKSFDNDKLLKNYNAVIEALEKEKSNNTVKGDLVKNTFITSSMGVSYKVKLGKNI